MTHMAERSTKVTEGNTKLTTALDSSASQEAQQATKITGKVGYDSTTFDRRSVTSFDKTSARPKPESRLHKLRAALDAD